MCALNVVKGMILFMKKCYVSTFISGLSLVVEKLLKEEIEDLEVVKVFDGMIIYKTAEFENILKLKFINNTFLLLGLKHCDLSTSFNFEMKNLLKKVKLNFLDIKKYIKYLRKKNFKILAIDKNQPVSIDYHSIIGLESTISSNLNIYLNKRNPDLEFIFLRRTEGIILFLLKLTYNRITEKKLFKGELRPELAYILVSLANLDKNKIVMDPFCGHGSIPKQIVKNFKYNMCFASDNNDELVKELKTEYKKNNKKLFIKNRNALELSYFEDNFIDAIVTDPPWNIYDSKEEDFSVFYKKMLKEFYRILKDNGILVILMGNIQDFEKALLANNFFKTSNKFNILVNGKKANIYVLRKIC